MTYLTPVVGVALGVLLLGERITGNQPVGALAAVLGIAISQNRIRLR
ncbi:EamA family transporter [Nostocoides sp.]|nr:EamA family transporter [Tetrasphaera sp.]